MEILYVTRHFNHSGYLILERLIKDRYTISSVLLHKNEDPWRNPFFRPFLIGVYQLKCWYYRCKPLKTTKSEELLAKSAQIPIIWTQSIKSDEFYASLKKLNPDLIVLGGGWHELIPERVYNFPKLGCINTHPSLLPEFRGTSITRWQTLCGVKRSGSTIHYVDDTFDTGGVLSQETVEIPDNTTPQELFYLSGVSGAKLMSQLLKEFTKGIKPNAYHVDHNSDYYQYFSRWQWNETKLVIDWHWSLRDIHYFVLANTQESYEYLGPIFYHNGKSYVLRETSLLNEISSDKENTSVPLRIVKIDKCHVFLQRSDGAGSCLILRKVQLYDKYYKYRRSYEANVLLNMETGNIIN